MIGRLAVALVFVATASATAFAQAPGETVPVAPPGIEPIAAPRPSVMDHRWAIGISIGGLGVAPEQNPDAQTKFQIGAIAIRYRAASSIEFALELAGGSQVLESGDRGDLDTSGVMIVGRYRFMPEEPWNLFLTGGFGALVIARSDATDQERQNAGRPQGMLGIGLERRFERFALQAEARIVGVGPRDQQDTPPVTGTITKLPIDPPPPADTDKLSGGTFTIGLSYYW
jgi:hypothetical protein